MKKVNHDDPLHGRRTAPKWGTLEWIMAYPHSRMDRKRRRRAEKVVDQEALKALKEGPHTCCLVRKMLATAKAYGVNLAKEDTERFVKALEAVDGYECAIYDRAFADLLGKAWRIDTAGIMLDGRKGFCR